MATEVPLSQLQTWMQSYIVFPGATVEAMEAASQSAGLEEEKATSIILPSKTLTGQERLNIYRGMYLLRMNDALAADFFAVEHFLGEDDFFDLVARYVQQFPSRSFTLNRLSDNFPEYIQTDNQVPNRAFVHDLARLELAVTQVFDAELSSILTSEMIQDIPADAWEFARFRPVNGFQTLAHRYPVNAYLEAVRSNSHRPKIKRQDTWVAVCRREYSVWRFDLTRPAFEMLTALTSGMPLGEAILATTRRFSSRGVKEQIFQWFREWVNQGFFQSVELEQSQGE